MRFLHFFILLLPTVFVASSVCAQSIEVSLPGGSSVRSGQAMTVRWKASNLPPGAGLVLMLYSASTRAGGFNAGPIMLRPIPAEATGSHTWNAREVGCAPTDYPMWCPINPGKYKIVALVFDRPTFTLLGWPDPNPPKKITQGESPVFEITGDKNLKQVEQMIDGHIGDYAAEKIGLESNASDWLIEHHSEPVGSVVEEEEDRYCFKRKMTEPFQGEIRACQYGLGFTVTASDASGSITEIPGVYPFRLALAAAERAIKNDYKNVFQPPYQLGIHFDRWRYKKSTETKNPFWGLMFRIFETGGSKPDKERIEKTLFVRVYDSKRYSIEELPEYRGRRGEKPIEPLTLPDNYHAAKTFPADSTDPPLQYSSKLCTLSPFQPPKDLVVYAASGAFAKKLDWQIDDSGQKAGLVEVTVNSKRPVALLLSAYNPTVWRISRTNGTDIAAVVVTGYHAQALAGLDESVPGIISTFENRGACGNTVFSGKDKGKIEPLSKKLFGSPPKATAESVQGAVTLGDPVGADEALLTSDWRTVESYRSKDRPVAGLAGVDQAVNDGHLRPAGKDDIDKAKKLLAALKPGARVSLIRPYVIVKPFTIPAGLYGGNTVTFILEKGVPAPGGNLGHATLFNLNDGTCIGFLCESF